MGDSLALTYEELAERLGIGPDSARIKAKRMERRGECRITRGNDGKARVTLSAELLPEHPPERTGSSQERSGERSPELYGELLGLLAELKESRQRRAGETAARVRELEQEVGRLRVELARAHAERQAVKAVAIADVTAARDVAAAEVETVKAELAARDELVAELRRSLEWHQRPWWRRMLG